MTGLSAPVAPITDAVVVLPGIMGSELVDAAGRVVWGMKLTMARAFLSHVYEGVGVTADELAGGPRLRASRLITRTGVLALFGSQGPYTRLVEELEAAAVHPAAVAPFPYDWRLSIEHNAALLSAFAVSHLRRWKATLAGIARDSEGLPPGFDVDGVRLSFVAHSMGGLIARWACLHSDVAQVTRQIVSLGTPYRGSAKTVRVLSAGSAARFLDEQAARRLAVTCPGVYDLLPREACLSRDGGWQPVTATDVDEMGGSAALATEAWTRWRAIDPGLPLAGVSTVPLVGFTLPTPRTVRRDADTWVVEPVDWQGFLAQGDGTVAYLAPPEGAMAQLQVAGHEQLPESPTVIQAVIRHLIGVPGPPISLAPPRALGLVAPVTAPPGRLVVKVNELGVSRPRRAGITVTSSTETADGRWANRVGWAFEGVAGGDLLFSRALPAGVHRITVTGGGRVGVACTTAVLADA